MGMGVHLDRAELTAAAEHHFSAAACGIALAPIVERS